MIGFANLAKQNARLADEMGAALEQLMRRGEFILGEPVAEFERAFAQYCEVEHAVAVNSGTSALHLALLAAGIGPGDEVITTALTFVATVAAIGYTGARPVLVDVDPHTLNINPEQIERTITARTRAILPVHLYGQPADMDPIREIARRQGLVVIEDAAQAHGARYKGRRAGSLGDAACFSFYPSKNLGACGEGGIVVTNRDDWARKVRSLRDWGHDGRGSHSVKAFNYRMETFQGAVLGIKLRFLDAWNATRREHAAAYDQALGGGPPAPIGKSHGAEHVYHIYAVRSRERAVLRERLQAAGIETRVHYAAPVHLMEAWSDLGYRQGDFPEAEKAANQVLSIPVHPESEAQDVALIVEALCELRTASGNPG